MTEALRNMKAAEIRTDLARMARDSFARLKAAGVVRVQWVSAGDGKECDFCKAMDGRIQLLDELDGVCEHSGCTGAAGCRCVCGPADT